MAIIVNNESRVLILADGHRVVRLTPGANQLDNDQWARVRAHVLDRLGEKKDDKSITEIGVEAKKGTGKDAKETLVCKDINELSVKDASELVAKTLDVSVLKAWKKKVTREDLRAEILTQIENMEKR